ncbi:MAG: 4Fe-4S dicluster domain-containing protein [Planctomycetota bacterium]|nr:4Fe-4S dicluster domain-containing protein [Planctomycetota bacterium]
MILVDIGRCTGCRLCEMVCSVKNEGVTNPTKARIQVVKWDTEGTAIPVVCQQCEDAPCAAVCPVSAISRDSATGALKINNEKCIRCRICVQACPFGAIGYNAQMNKVFKCELCDGEPMCVAFCEPQALLFTDSSKASFVKRRFAAEKLAATYKHSR